MPIAEMLAYVHKTPCVPILFNMGSYRVVKMKLMNHMMAMPNG